jgi:hypothetical protein
LTAPLYEGSAVPICREIRGGNRKTSLGREKSIAGHFRPWHNFFIVEEFEYRKKDDSFFTDDISFTTLSRRGT